MWTLFDPPPPLLYLAGNGKSHAESIFGISHKENFTRSMKKMKKRNNKIWLKNKNTPFDTFGPLIEDFIGTLGPLKCATWGHIQGRIQGFKLGGGAHLKRLRRAEGGANMFGVFRVKNHDFNAKKILFFPILGGGGGGCAPPSISP